MAKSYARHNPTSSHAVVAFTIGLPVFVGVCAVDQCYFYYATVDGAIMKQLEANSDVNDIYYWYYW